MRYEEALNVADRMIEYLRPACEGWDLTDRSGIIQFAGSLRRGKKEIDEIDLIAIPDLTPPPRPRAEFGKPVPKAYETRLDQLIDDLSLAGKIVGVGGPRNKKFFYKEIGIRFDLYLVRPPATWGVQWVIRTGPREFSHWVVTQRHKGGALPNGYRVQGGAVWEGEAKVKDSELLHKTPIGFETEDSFFSFLGLDWIYPEDRVAKWR